MIKQNITIVCVSLFCAFCFLNCFSPDPKRETELLVKAFCGQCHLPPDPSALDKQTWRIKLLPRMGWYLGHMSDGFNAENNTSLQDFNFLLENKYLPQGAQLNEEQWQAIRNYFVTHAPHNLPPIHEKPAGILQTFQEVLLSLENMDRSLINLTKMTTDHTLIVGDYYGNLNEYDSDLDEMNHLNAGTPIVWFDQFQETNYILSIGQLNPNERPLGWLGIRSKEEMDLLIGGLIRPVHFNLIQEPNMKKPHFLISEFGYFKGRLTFYRWTDYQMYIPQILSDLPGAMQTEWVDFNKNGLVDILGLFGQAQEGIYLFLNQGDWKFDQQVLFRFPPEFGASYFELVDFNGDGHKDILLANGDNADYTMILKPYHGVHIYLNDGKNEFEKVYFKPIYGATKALARDFDQDGDLDMAVIAFFPDFENAPEKGFVFMENVSLNNQFRFESFLVESASLGRWLTMDAGDIDQDGDEDIILGSFINSPSPVPGELMQSWIEKGVDVMVLKNKLIE
jgi:hypothetical protein